MTGFETFLAEALPPLGLAPRALIRRNIRRRVVRRMESVGIHEFRAYLSFLRRNPGEWDALRPLFTVTISRFFRNRRVFKTLSRDVLSSFAARGRPARAWCAGCASGEEAFTLRILWEELPGRNPVLAILATDIDDACLRRAGNGLYRESSLREVPPTILEKYFRKEEERFRLREDIIRSVEFRNHDLLRNPPPGAFDLVLCRNAVFTYFSTPSRVAVTGAIARALSPEGFLVIGRTEKLPPEAAAWFTPAYRRDNIYRCLS